MGEAPQPLVVALYLPQYHPLPENDEFWGAGHTEWRSVADARPRFEGHRQPRRPADLGYYDLRLPDTRERQAQLARAGGIDAFMYYHYWFAGRRVMPRPFDEVMATGRPDMPVCLCWANHDWNRNDNGSFTNSPLIEQRYSDADDREHAEFLADAFSRPNYLRLDGRPVFAIYRTQTLPDARRTLSVLAEACAARGVPAPYVVRFETNGSELDPAEHGCDAAAELYPHWLYHHPELQPPALALGHELDWLCDYGDIARTALGRQDPPWVRYPCVVPDWDTTARRPDGGAWGVVGSTPDKYEAWLRAALDRARRTGPAGRQMVIVNAWNEWSECGYLEPDMDHGHAYLDATRRAVEAVRGPLRPALAATWSDPDADADAGADPALTTAALLGRLDALERSYAALLGEHEAWKAMQPRLVAHAVADAEARLGELRAALEAQRAALAHRS